MWPSPRARWLENQQARLSRARHDDEAFRGAFVRAGLFLTADFLPTGFLFAAFFAVVRNNPNGSNAIFMRNMCNMLPFDCHLFIALGNNMRRNAVVRSLEVIGEATKNLPEEVREKYPEIPWKRMAGMRDKLIHGYFGVDYESIWSLITERVSSIEEPIKRIIREHSI